MLFKSLYYVRHVRIDGNSEVCEAENEDQLLQTDFHAIASDIRCTLELMSAQLYNGTTN
jgi:hypothetical protein